MLLFSYLNSAYETGIKSPLDEAIVQHGRVDITGYSKVSEIPFDFERCRLSVIVRHEEECFLITKGAPESILPLCCAYEVNGEHKVLDGIDGEVSAKCVQLYRDLSAQGYRVLAVVYRPIAQQTLYQCVHPVPAHAASPDLAQ